jgi:Tfp pilus assembly protein PilE
MKNFKNQKGFTAFEAVLVVVIVGLIGYLGYQAYAKSQKTSSTQTATTATVAAPDPYAGWLTFKSSQDNLSFRYPEDWKITDQTNGDGFYVESISLKSPNSFEVDVTVDPNGIGGGCPGCSTSLKSLTKVAGIKNDTVYVAEMVTKGDDTAGSGMKEIGLVSESGLNHFNVAGAPKISLAEGSIVDWIGWPMYLNPSGKLVWTRTNASQNEKSYTQTPDQFFQQPDVQAAEKILKSFSYK